MQFTKMQGLGNDYICINCLGSGSDNLPELVRKLADRHFGVGADGVILILPSEWADFRMQMFNPDGSEGAMCGNGIRCMGAYLIQKRLSEKRELRIETKAGVKNLEIKSLAGPACMVCVDMGVPQLGRSLGITVMEEHYTGIEISMGNPHFVVAVEDPDLVNVPLVGSRIGGDAVFPEGTNVEFATRERAGTIRMRVWERGCGETLACGTGACAAVAALGEGEREFRVLLPGGALKINRQESGTLLMTGPASIVYEGETVEGF